MDMTIPGTSGLEITKAIHEFDPGMKVIIVSSMMDEEIIRKARKENVSGYIQKPVDSEEITLLINRIMANEELYIELESKYSNIFKEAILDLFNKLTKTVPEFISESHNTFETSSRGISIVMGIIGKYSGRMIYDLSRETAENLAKELLKREPKDNEETLNMMGEIVNMATGNACSMVNKTNKLFGLRVAPPTIFHGSSINISKGELESNFYAVAKTNFGEITINVAFKRGEEEWMSNL
jgi:CheY-specific phosphatase CheX